MSTVRLMFFKFIGIVLIISQSFSYSHTAGPSTPCLLSNSIIAGSIITGYLANEMLSLAHNIANVKPFPHSLPSTVIKI